MVELIDPTAHPVVLASSSASRTTMLANAGVPHVVVPPAVDEAEVKHSLVADKAPGHAVAETLAELKAMSVARQRPGALVIGADQVLVCGDVLFDKPADRDGARAHLVALRGRMHILHASACVVQDQQRLWHHNGMARLHMRDLSDSYIEQYLDAVGADACRSVGAYQLEGLGGQLFARVEGDWFTILGMPLLPLLAFLRQRGVIAT